MGYSQYIFTLTHKTVSVIERWSKYKHQSVKVNYWYLKRPKVSRIFILLLPKFMCDGRHIKLDLVLYHRLLILPFFSDLQKLSESAQITIEYKRFRTGARYFSVSTPPIGAVRWLQRLCCFYRISEILYCLKKKKYERISLCNKYIYILQKCHVESAIKKYNDKNVRWSTQGMLRLSPEMMQSLFQPTLLRIRESIGNVLNNPDAKGMLTYLTKWRERERERERERDSVIWNLVMNNAWYNF